MPTAKSSPLVDTRVIYCGDNLEQLRKLPPGCIDLIYIDPPFDANRNYEVFWGETKEKRSFRIAPNRPRLTSIDRFFREEHRIIVPFTVREILDKKSP